MDDINISFPDDEEKRAEIIVAEHNVSHLSVRQLGNDELIQYFGHGTKWYFDFVKFNGFVNLLLSIFSLGFVVAVNEDGADDQKFFYALLGSTLTILMTSMLVWWRRLKINHVLSTNAINDATLNLDPISTTCDMKTKCCCSSTKKLAIFRLLLYLSFVGLFVAYYYCQKSLQEWASKNLSSFSFHTLVSFLFVVIDFIWRLCCNLITSFESHKYLESYQQSDCIKSFFARIILFSLFSAGGANASSTSPYPLTESTTTHNSTTVFDTSISTNNSGGVWARETGGSAPIMLVMNALLAPIVDVLTVVVYNKLCVIICCGSKSRKADGEFQYRFNVADEYTQLLFRQYLINQYILQFPLAPVIGVVGCFIEWWADKYKLIKLCQVSQRHNNSFSNIILAFLFINSIAILFAYPNGLLF
jgi:hypothetical protein